MKRKASLVDVLDWARENNITLLPCTPKSKKPMTLLSTRSIYGNDPEMAKEDSFHQATEERLAVIETFWAKRDYINQLNEKDIGASIEMNPGFNNGTRMCCIDVDSLKMVNEALQNDFFKDCPAITGKKGLKIFCKLIERNEIPDPILQFYEEENPNPQLEIFTQDRHALIFGEHPDSTRDNPINYMFVRGFGEMIPELEWDKVLDEIMNLAARNNLALRGERKPISFDDDETPKVDRESYSADSIVSDLHLDVQSIAMPSGKIHREGDEIRGENPWHGSTSGNNFVINPTKNTWYCHRCESGGGALEAFAIREGILQCHEAQPGTNSLDGKWTELFDALKKSGYKIPKPKKSAKTKQKTKKEENKAKVEKNVAPKVDSRYTKTALEILKREGQPLKYMLNTFARSHVGDQVVAECLILSLASQVVENTKGIHVFISGKSGKGKSHCAAMMLEQVPEEYKIDGSMSDKVLFYLDSLQDGTVFVFDDKDMSDDMSDTFKNSTTRFKKGYTHFTLDKNREAIGLTIPPRCVWWMARVEDPGDEQVQNRMLMPWIDDSPEQDKRVNEYELNEETKELHERIRDMESTVVCQEMWRILRRRLIFVRVPYSNYIKFGDVERRRDTGMLMDRVKAYAALNFMNRNPKIVKMPDGSEIISIEASQADFESAQELDEEAPKQGGGLRNRLIKTEAMAIETIRRMGWREFTMEDLQRAMALSYTSVYRIFHGRKDRIDDSSGLIGKCPAISMDKITISEDADDLVRKSKHVNRYKFDPETYSLWVGQGGIWLDTETWRRDPEHPDNEAIINEDLPRLAIADLERDVLGEALGTAEVMETELEIAAESLTKPTHVADEEPTDHHHLAATSSTVAPSVKGAPVHKPERTGGTRTSETPMFEVKAQDYIEMRPPEVGTCERCGEKGILYNEKFNEEMKSTKRPSRKICKKCYTTASRVENAIGQGRIEGLVDINNCERVTENVGMCDQCGVQKGEYREKTTNMYLCEGCYRNEVAKYNKRHL